MRPTSRGKYRDRQVTEAEFKELAAGVFGVPSAQLKLDMHPEDLPQWDSLNHLQLITAFENKAGVRLSMRQIQSIGALGDFLGLQAAAS